MRKENAGTTNYVVSAFFRFMPSGTCLPGPSPHCKKCGSEIVMKNCFLLLSKPYAMVDYKKPLFTSGDNIWVLPVCTMPDDVKDKSDFELKYSRNGKLSKKLNDCLIQSGADETHIHYLNYYRPVDGEIKENIRTSDYIILPGGEMSSGYRRIRTFGLDAILRDTSATITGISAGALILFQEYFITPNWYYKTFSFDTGLGLLDPDWMIEVHYSSEDEKQNAYLRYVRQIRPQTRIYAIQETGYLFCHSDGRLEMKNVTIF